MEVLGFGSEHLKEASELALLCYNEERVFINCLPEINGVPNLSRFAENGLGAAAVENGKLIGYLCFYTPWKNAFCTEATGTFSPLCAHGAVADNREYIYKRLYQYAAEILVSRGVGSHGVTLYAHDSEAGKAFFTYGFGLRCVDAVRPAELIPGVPESHCVLRALALDETQKVRGLRRALSEHLGKSPCFMYSSEDDYNEWIYRAEHRDTVLFTAFDGDTPVAFIEMGDEGENFTTVAPDIKNICGAYCLPEYRGHGIVQSLINYAVTVLPSGIKRIGVDFESFNATANAFWLKHFDAYTHSVVRMIDELTVRAAVRG